jgi:hypothetical protein
MREPERFEGITNWRLDCSSQIEELQGTDDQWKRAARFMATVLSELHKLTDGLNGWQIAYAIVIWVHFTKGACLWKSSQSR